MKKQTVGLLLAAAAAYGVYKYSKLTPEEKKKMADKGKDLIEKNLEKFAEFFGVNKSKSSNA